MSTERNEVPTTTAELRVALIIPEKNLIVVSPDSDSGLFVGEHPEGESTERAAHKLVAHELGSSALSSVKHLGAFEDGSTKVIGYALEPSYRSGIDFQEAGLNTQPLDTYTPISDIDQHFISRLR